MRHIAESILCGLRHCIDIAACFHSPIIRTASHPVEAVAIARVIDILSHDRILPGAEVEVGRCISEFVIGIIDAVVRWTESSRLREAKQRCKKKCDFHFIIIKCLKEPISSQRTPSPVSEFQASTSSPHLP